MRALAALALGALALSWALAGPAPLGRALMALGLPQHAAPLMEDPQWRGIALYRAGEFEAAAEAFTDARAFFNLGNTQARLGNYAASLEAFDLAASRGDADARANFDVVAAYFAGLGIDPDALGLFPERNEGPEMESFIARGDGRAAGTGDEVTNTNTMMGLAELDSRGRLGVRRIFDDSFMVADERWLEQLPDVPGAYLSARILAEHKRRAAADLSPPAPEDPR